MSCGPLHWGDVPGWIEAIATVGALVAAGWAVWKSSQLVRIERDRDLKRDAEAAEQRELAEAAHQADDVAAWPDGGGPEHPSASLAAPSPPVARLLNGSRLPIYDVWIEFSAANRRVEVEAGQLGPGESKTEGWPQGARGPASELVALAKRGKLLPGADFRVGVRFRDTAGREWRRDENGRLQLTGRRTFGGAAVAASAAIIADGLVSSGDD